MSTLLVENIKHEDATDIAIVLAANGTLGIGTVGTARNDPLTVKGLNNIAKFESSAAAVELRVNTPTVDKIGLTTGTNDNFFINVGGSDRLYIANGGNVGIGTDNPGYKLHVQGGTLGLFASGANTTAPSLTWGTSSSHILRTEDSELAIGLDNSAPYNLYLQARTNANFERPIIINPVGGNVGIGTRNPTTKLNVSGDLKVENGVIKLPAFASDPAGPTAGDMYYNSTDNVVKHYDGSKWLQMSNKFSATGGVEYTFTDNGVNYKSHVFTSSGSFFADSPVTIDILIVGGGGSGGGHACPGGGGAGGLIYKTSHSLSGGTYPIVVGAGGATKAISGPGGYSAGNKGSDSTAFGLTAKGGGAGVVWDAVDAASVSGGSSGGYGTGGTVNTGYVAPTQPTQAGESGIYGYGNGGGDGTYFTSPYPGGGGGGAGAAGQASTSGSAAGYGGIGRQYNMTGTPTYYAGGGCGGGWATVSLPAPQPGGGGAGDCADGSGSGTSARGFSGYSQGENGQANTGGGGGGAGRTGGEISYVGAGGSGIVIIRYQID